MFRLRQPVLLLLFSIACCGCNRIHLNVGGGASVRETRTIVVDHVDDTAIDVESVNGAITVTQADRADVQVIAHIRAQTDDRLQATNLIVTRDELDNLHVAVDWPGDRKNNEGCAFEIELPNAKNVHLRTSNGKIALKGLSGEAKLKTTNGAVRVDGLNGNVEVDTSNGSVKVSNVDGNVDADTKNGSVEIVGAKHEVVAGTSNGSVKLKLADVDSAGPIRSTRPTAR